MRFVSRVCSEHLHTGQGEIAVNIQHLHRLRYRCARHDCQEQIDRVFDLDCSGASATTAALSDGKKAHVEGWPISLHRTPLDWLRANCRGACLLDHCEAAWWETAA